MLLRLYLVLEFDLGCNRGPEVALGLPPGDGRREIPRSPVAGSSPAHPRRHRCGYAPGPERCTRLARVATGQPTRAPPPASSVSPDLMTSLSRVGVGERLGTAVPGTVCSRVSQDHEAFGARGPAFAAGRSLRTGRAAAPKGVNHVVGRLAGLENATLGVRPADTVGSTALVRQANPTGVNNGGQRSTTLESGAKTDANPRSDLGKCWWAILGSNQ